MRLNSAAKQRSTAALWASRISFISSPETWHGSRCGPDGLAGRGGAIWIGSGGGKGGGGGSTVIAASTAERRGSGASGFRKKKNKAAAITPDRKTMPPTKATAAPEDVSTSTGGGFGTAGCGMATPQKSHLRRPGTVIRHGSI